MDITVQAHHVEVDTQDRQKMIDWVESCLDRFCRQHTAHHLPSYG